MAQNNSRLKQRDYDILYSGTSIKKGTEPTTDSPEFGLLDRDYIEMSILNNNNVVIDSFVVARGNQIGQHFDDNGDFFINPGIFMREKGYFSGDYNIEFNFLRETAGSPDKIILVDEDNDVWNGEITIDEYGTIFKSIENEETGENEQTGEKLREVQYKYYIDEISSDRTEVRIAQLPIEEDTLYTEQFKGLSADGAVLRYDGLSLKFPDEEGGGEKKNFDVLTEEENIITKDLIGGELIIPNAFQILDLSSLREKDDDGNLKEDGFRFLNGTKTKNIFNNFGGVNVGGTKLGNLVDYNIGDNNYYVDLPGSNIPFNAARDSENGNQYMFYGIEVGKDEYFNNTEKFNYFTESWPEFPDRRLFGGAGITGWRTATRKGYPLHMYCGNKELQKLKHFDCDIDIYLTGKTLVNSQTFEHRLSTKFQGENTFIDLIVPVELRFDNVRQNGALWSGVFTFTYNVLDKQRKFIISAPNIFAVVPDNNEGASESFVKGGWSI